MCLGFSDSGIRVREFRMLTTGDWQPAADRGSGLTPSGIAHRRGLCSGSEIRMSACDRWVFGTSPKNMEE